MRQAVSPPVLVFGAHSLRAVSQRIAASYCQGAANGAFVPMHLHIAEQQREVDQCLAVYGQAACSLVAGKLSMCPATGAWCTRRTWMHRRSCKALAASGAVAALCPSTEANLGDGLFPLHDFLTHGGRIAIGSDSHVSINPFEELRWLEYGQRLATHIAQRCVTAR